MNKNQIRPRNTTGILSGIVFFLCWMFLAPVHTGCNSSEFNSIKEGMVVYDVSFETNEMSPMIKAMLPSEVTTYFSDNKTCTVISMGMNMMETRLISDAMNYTYTTLVSAMGRKVAMVMDKKQVESNYLDRVALQVRHTSDKKEIAGISCSQALITDSTNHTYPVYYTEEILVKDPNWSSPFHDIEGMLMEYSINLNGIVMNLKAKKIVNNVNDKSLFEIPKGYEIIKDPSEFKFTM